MTFDEVLNDIEKMVGLELESIKPGANITLKEIDREAKRIGLITYAGKEKTRPFSELKKIWDKLCSAPAAHVDSVLGGSGSSRNQPETVMANLPYVEWFVMDGKKHLTLMKEPTHDYGTLCKMDEMDAEELKQKLQNIDKIACEVVILTDDIKSAAVAYEGITGLPLKPLSPGVYEQIQDNVRFIIVSRNSILGPVETGTYVVVKGNTISGTGSVIRINDTNYSIQHVNGLNLMVCLTKSY